MDKFPTPKPRPKEPKKKKTVKVTKKTYVDQWFPKKFLEKYTKRIQEN